MEKAFSFVRYTLQNAFTRESNLQESKDTDGSEEQIQTGQFINSSYYKIIILLKCKVLLF